MDTLLGGFAFAVLVMAQLLAVVAVCAVDPENLRGGSRRNG
jgi:hypothetical protein